MENGHLRWENHLRFFIVMFDCQSVSIACSQHHFEPSTTAGWVASEGHFGSKQGNGIMTMTHSQTRDGVDVAYGMGVGMRYACLGRAQDITRT